MKNYEKVVEHQKKIRKEKEQKAIAAINCLYDNRKLVTVKELVEVTGLSRSYFYKNEKVNEILRKVLALQNGDSSFSPKNEVFNNALEKSYKILEKQVIVLKHKNKMLFQENEELKLIISKLNING